MKDFSVDMKQAIANEFSSRRAKAIDPFRHTVGWPLYDEQEIYAALDCLLDLRLSQGPKVREFESAYADYLGLPPGGGAVAVNSGSSANLVAFSALIQVGKLRTGDEVICPAATFATVSSPLYQLGLVPVYVDSEMDTLNLDPQQVEKAISDKTKAIMVVHNLGVPAEMDSLMAIAAKHSLIVIEDCCEAHGSYYRGRQVGSIGHMATLSFFVAHNITTGEGGMVFFQDGAIDNRVRSVREFGRSINSSSRYVNAGELGEYDSRYIFETLGYNVRMTDFAAAMGLVQLTKLETLNAQRRTNAQKLRNIISKFDGYFSTVKDDPDHKVGYYGFPILITEKNPLSRNALCRHLEKDGIETRPNMGGCLPDQPGFLGQNHRICGDLKNARYIKENAFFVGVHSGLTDEDFDLFEASISSAYGLA